MISSTPEIPSPPDPANCPALLGRIEAEIHRVIVGQNYLVERLVVALLARGHLLIEGFPGLAKTLAVKTLAAALDVDFRRIQFTPDLLPADLVGTLIYDQSTGAFKARKGPIFSDLVLADEINRASAKVQSALLEAMEERQVTLGDASHRLSPTFTVLATQNPIEHEGTYPLAEAQVDRFMMKLRLDFPSREEEAKILDRMLVQRPLAVSAITDAAGLEGLREAADRVHLDSKLRGYILDLVRATRRPAAVDLPRLKDWIERGASPRATLFLARSAKALALLRGRDHVLPEDVKEIAADVLRHRVMVSWEAEAEGIDSDQLIERLLGAVVVP